MIIIRTPYRISFFGGSTDYPAWYRQHGGAVISTTINKYSFLVLRKLPPIFDYKYRIRYYDRQETNTFEDIQVPVIREAIRYTGFDAGLDITHHGDLPNRTGVGSSSSFTVGLLHGLSVLQNRQITKRDLELDIIDVPKLKKFMLHNGFGESKTINKYLDKLETADSISTVTVA